MNKKLLGLGVVLATGGIALATSVGAFWGGNMTADKFQEFKAMVSQSTDFESFRAAMKVQRGDMMGQRQNFQDKVSFSVENIENGVIRTITSEDADVVSKLQSREMKTPKNENVTRTVENISNGVKITITSEDADEVTHIQSQGENPRMGGRGQGGKHGFGKGNRKGGEGRGFGRGENVEKTQE
jgi:hypothetical protein